MAASSAAAVRKSIKAFEDGLLAFAAELSQETGELRRNVENQPCTGATFYRNILEDLQRRLEGVGQELAALQALSADAVSMEVGCRCLAPSAATLSFACSSIELP